MLDEVFLPAEGVRLRQKIRHLQQRVISQQLWLSNDMLTEQERLISQITLESTQRDLKMYQRFLRQRLRVHLVCWVLLLLTTVGFLVHDSLESSTPRQWMVHIILNGIVLALGIHAILNLVRQLRKHKK